MRKKKIDYLPEIYKSFFLYRHDLDYTHKLVSQSACNALMRRCFHRVVMLYALLILKNVLVEQMVFYPFCLKSKYYLLSFWFNFMVLLTSLIVIWNEGIIDFKSFDKSIVFRFSLTRTRIDQCYGVELIAQLHNIILCRKINRDPKADHTLEFTPLNYSLTPQK